MQISFLDARNLVVDILVKHNVTSDHAGIVAEHLVDAAAAGHAFAGLPRVLALDSVITSGVMALANLVAGAVAAYTGNPHIAGLTTAGISLVGACIWLWAARGK